MKYIIGLTGNLGSGKSTVLKILRDLGAYTIDADALVREITAPGEEGWQKVKEAFAPQLGNLDGEIDRRRLGKLVFSDPQALARLESILHPQVEERARQLMAQSKKPVVVIEAVKLIEAGMHRRCDALWVVVSDPKIAGERLRASGKWSEDEIEARLRNQGPAEEKILLADVVIDNSGSKEETQRQVEVAWSRIPRE